MMRADRRVVLGGIAALLLAVLLYQLLAGPTAAPAPEAPPIAQPPPPPPSPAATQAPPPSQAATPEGLRLHGLTGAGAIIGMPDGRQRLVRLGADVLPGLRLDQVRVDHALLKSAAGEFRLDFTGVAAAQPANGTAPAATTTIEAAVRDDTLRYRLGLEPRRVNGQVMSHVLRPGQNLPVLQRAGLRPGDVILSVNGNLLNEEQVMELAWNIAQSERVVFEIERDGRRMQLATEGGQGR